MGNLNKIFNSLNVVSEGDSYNTIGFLVSKSGSTTTPGLTSFIVRDDGKTGVNIALPTAMLTVSGDCRIVTLPTGGTKMVTADNLGNLKSLPMPGFPPINQSGCTLTGITVVGPIITFHLAGTGCTSFTASTSGQVIGPYEFGLGLNAIQPILPGNNFADAQFSNIQGGTNNRIQVGSQRSSILGGLGNRLVNNSSWSSILSGIGNRLDDAQVSTIVSGKDNDILITGGTSGYGAILNGFENLVNHQYSAIMGGANMTTNRDFTVFMRGLDVDTDAFDPLGVMQQSPFRYHGGFANNGNIGDILTSVDTLGNARWMPFGFPQFGTGCTVTGITVSGPVITFHTVGPDCSGNTFTASTSSGTLSPYEFGVGMDSIKPILGSLQTSGPRASIGGGHLNHIVDSHSGRIGGGLNNLISGATGAGIQAGASNVIRKSHYGHIGGGVANTIGTDTLSVYSSVIGGGAQNNIVGTYGLNVIGGGYGNEIGREGMAIGQGWSNIVGGYDNSIYGRYLAYSSIVGGYRNEITGSTYAFIGGGQSNKIYDSEGTLNYSSIGGGVDNKVFDSRYGFIGGGSDNRLDDRGNYNFIGGGSKNTVGNRNSVLWSNYSSIVGGAANKIYGDGVADYAGIVNGSGNTVERNYSAIIGGRGLTADRTHTTFMQGLDVNTNHDGVTRPFRYHGIYANNGNVGDVLTAMDAFGNASWQPKTWGPISGDCYVVSATTDSGTCITTFYLSGVGCGSFTASTCDGSFSPYRPTGNQSIVPTIPAALAVNTNVIDFSSNNSNIGGGELNRILGWSTNALIAGGRGNRVINVSAWSNVGGGVSNTIDDSRVSSILGGHQNDINITGFSNGYGLITAGFQNLVTEAYGSIINGRDNIVQDQYSAIIGSRAKTTDRTYTTFTEGLDVDSNRADGSLDGQAFRYFGTFANPGLDRVLTDVDGLGNAVWKDIGFPDFGGTGCTITGITLVGNVITFGVQGPDCSGFTFTASTTTGTISPYEYSTAIDGIVPIMPLGPLENRNPHGTYNRIGGGDTNHIYYTNLNTPNIGPLPFMVLNNTIGNGSMNVISGSSTYSTIGNGVENNMYGTLSTIFNGRKNRIGNYSASMGMYMFGHMDTILNGKENWIKGTHSSIAMNRDIFNGYRNIINSGSTYASILNGSDNFIKNSYYAAILGGRHNIIQARYAAIVNGTGNTITRNTIASAIIGAIGRSAANSETTYTRGLDVNTDGYDGTNRPFLYAGAYANHGTAGHVLTSVDAFGRAHWAPSGVVWTDGCPIVSAYTTNSGCILHLVNCSGDTITADTCNSFGALSPYELRGGLDSISTALPNSLAWNTNYIAPNLSFSNIQGGASNSLNSGGQYNAILGGRENWIGSDGHASPQGNIYWSNIGGGIWNQIRGYDIMGGLIAGGTSNVLTASTNSVVSGGYRNRVSGGQKHTIGGGGDNRIWGIEGNAIVGGLENRVYNGDGNIVGGGGSNTITEWVGAMAMPSSYSLIGGGWTNVIEGSVASSIVGGLENSIISSEPAYMFIGGGQENAINNSHASSIVGGRENTLEAVTYDFIGGGRLNSTSSGSYNSSIVGGYNNSIDINHSFIGGGEGNTVTNNSTYSSILGGFQNTINPLTGNANYSAIVNGSDNTIQHIYSAIIGGANLTTNRQYTTFMEGLDVNTNRGGAGNAQAFRYHGTFANNGNPGDVLTAMDAFGNASWQPKTWGPVSGDCYVVSATTDSGTCVTTFFLSGTDCGTVTASTCDGSFSPYRPTGTNSIVPTVPGPIAFGENIIDVASNNSNVGGGTFNRIINDSDTSVISGGRGNVIRNNSTWSNIGGGVANLIDDSEVSSILGGHHNEITIPGGGSGYGVVGGGFQNTVNARYGSIINGANNTVAGGALGDFSTILSSANKVTDRTYTTFTEGLDVDTNRADGSLDGQAFRYYGTWAQVGMRKVLTDIDGAGTAVWMDPPNPPQNPNCPYVSAFTTNNGCTLNLINCTGGTFTADTCNTFQGPYRIGSGVNSIEPTIAGLGASSAAGFHSNIQGGYNNDIDASSTASAIVGGAQHTITGSYDAFVGSGFAININNSHRSSIVGGYSNEISHSVGSSSDNFIGGGFTNKILNVSVYSSIGGGHTNLISASTYSSIVGGGGNTIDSTEGATITGGKDNVIKDNSKYSSVGGSDSTIEGTSQYSTIGNGRYNKIANLSYYSFIGGGFVNNIDLSSTASIVGGQMHDIVGVSDNSNIGGGHTNLISASTYSSIVGGLYNKLFSSGRSAVISGQNNKVVNSLYGVVVNGSNNTIHHDNSVILGTDNRTTALSHTTYLDGLDIDSVGSGGNRYLKYHGALANPAINRVLTSVDNLGNAEWKDIGVVPANSACPIVSAYTTNSGCVLNLVNCTGGTITASTCNSFGGVSPYEIGQAPGMDSIQPILPVGVMKNLADAIWCNIGGGRRNYIDTTSHVSNIGGGDTNTIKNWSQESFIGGGWENSIDNSLMSSVVGGDRNSIGPKSNYSSIVGGKSNEVSNSAYSIIGAGELNKITGTTKSIIGAGEQNKIFNSEQSNISAGKFNEIIENTWYSNIGAGTDNVIKGNSSYSSIAAGGSNLMTNSSSGSKTKYSFIGAGTYNILSGASWSTIVSGIGNKIIDTGDTPGAILTGQYNLIKDSEFTAIVNGKNNTINGMSFDSSAVIGADDRVVDRSHTTFMEGLDVDTNRGGAGNAQAFKYHGTFANNGNVGDVLTAMDAFGNASWQPIGIRPVSGDCYVVSATTDSGTCVTTFHLSGTDCGTVTASTCDGSYSPYRPTGDNSIVPTVPGPGGFGENVIDGTSTNSNVGGGTHNRITDNSDTSVISGGRGNRIRNVSMWSNIGGGVTNLIDDSDVSSILGGHHNTVSTGGGNQGYGTVINGYQNTVNHQYSVVMGGANITTNRDYTVFMRGLDVNTTEQNPTGPTVESPFRYHGGFANNGNVGDILTSVDTSGNSQWRDSGIVYIGDEVVVSGQTSGCILTLTTNSGNTITANTCTTYSGPYKEGQGWNNIIPTLPGGGLANYTDSTSAWSNIQGGLINTITGGIGSSILGGIANRITGSTYSAIISGQGGKIKDSENSVIVNGMLNTITSGATSSVIMGGGGIKAYTPQTTYMGYQQVLGRARISSTEYNNTNSLNSSYAKGTLDVVHDTSTITNLTADECGGEIVRFGDWDGTYAKGKLVQLRNGAWTEAKAVDTTMQGNMLGIALGSSVSNEGVLIRGFFNADTAYDPGTAGWTGGAPLYVHTGGGQVSPDVPSASSEYVRNIGYVVNSGQKYVYFNPESTYIVVH
jgi:hypothetical protein